MKIQAISCMIDWLEFSVFNLSECEVLYALGIHELNYEVKKGFYYNRVLNFENMVVINSEYKGNCSIEHVHVKLTGKGCRFMEFLYGTDNLRYEIAKRLSYDWFEMFFVKKDIKIKVSRLDIAIDYNFKFVIDFFEAILNERVKGVKTFDHAGSLKSGLTLYLGSRKSEKYIRLYEKDFEQKDFVNYKDRLELVLKNEYATFEFFNKNELIKIASTYMSDLEWQDAERQGLWADMKNGSCEISPKIKNRKPTLEEKTDYILNTFGKTLRAYVDEYGSDKITSAIHGAVLSENEIRMVNNERVISLIRYKKLSEQRSKELYSQIDENANDALALFEKSEKEKSPVFEQMKIV